MGIWDICHHKWDRRSIIPDRLLSLRLHNLGLVHQNVAELPASLGKNVTTLSMAFNDLTDAGFAGVQRIALRMVSSDLKGNNMAFAPESEGVLCCGKKGEFFGI